MKRWQETREVLERLADLERHGQRAALATVVGVTGSAYRREGAKLLVADDGARTGNVSGGCLEADVCAVALEVLRIGQATVRTYVSAVGDGAAWDLGLGCEGRVEILIEPAPRRVDRELELLEQPTPFVICTPLPGPDRLIVTSDRADGDLGSAALTRGAADRARDLLGSRASRVERILGEPVFFDVFEPPPQLLLCGAGADARPLAFAAAAVGFRVTVVDRREALLDARLFPPRTRLMPAGEGGVPEQFLSAPEIYALVMSHNFADDTAYLRDLLRSHTAYIGVLGPRARTERLLDRVGEAFRPDDPRVRGPVGLDIGAEGAEQIAVAIVAELLATYAHREAAAPRHAD